MTKPKHFPKSLFYAFLMLLSIGFGLASRRLNLGIPTEVNLYLGDAIWALMVYFGFRMFWPRLAIIQSAILAISFSFAIEISQLYQADWINEIRQTLLGGLILGFGFLWSDLVAYSIGVVFGFGIDYLLISQFIKNSPKV
ncbi:ribosomal maturation YjgA family protein [Psychroflexus aestuariivivens]|uniref:ribosomal maturation YjgA family protein n=1 Tax=Psychroflexus aestuariivivens TaxID=1795040 RepID=UPI000FDC3DD2|nr:DUF2809 domain-containing protein [Psychroflexus aestuariivivens]